MHEFANDLPCKSGELAKEERRTVGPPLFLLRLEGFRSGLYYCYPCALFLCRQLAEDILDLFDLRRAICVASRENESVFDIAMGGVNQRLGDAVRRILGLARRQTAVALFGRDSAVLDAIDERRPDRSSRHADGALDDDHVLFLRIQIGLLEIRMNVAFLGGHKPGAELNAVGAVGQSLLDVILGIDPTCDDERTVPEDPRSPL